MRRSSSPVLLAALAAGPIFLVSTAMAALYLEMPRPVPVDLGRAQIALAVLSFIPAIVFGCLISILPILAGSRLMLFTGTAFPAARARPIWIGAGGLFGALFAQSMTGFTAPAFDFGLIATSACCAAICRHSAHWD